MLDDACHLRQRTHRPIAAHGERGRGLRVVVVHIAGARERLATAQRHPGNRAIVATARIQIRRQLTTRALVLAVQAAVISRD